ncbi:MAG: thioesterase [Lachnospiraceae bacterium]
MYSFQSKVRYSEVGVDNRLTLDAVINYFQDCSSFHSESVGVGIDYLQEAHRCWILSSWEIIVERYPKHQEEIKIITWPCEMKGFFGTRNYRMEDAEGTVIAKANSLWVYMDTDKMRPVKIDRHMSEIYELSPAMDEDWHSRKLGSHLGGAEQEGILVQRYHLDTNNHVNNGKYILMAEAYLPAGFKVRSMRAEYKKAAVLGDILYPRVTIEDNEVIVTLCQEDHTIYATICFVR